MNIANDLAGSPLGAEGVNGIDCLRPTVWLNVEFLSLTLTLWFAESLDLSVIGTPAIKPRTWGSKTHPFWSN